MVDKNYRGQTTLNKGGNWLSFEKKQNALSFEGTLFHPFSKVPSNAVCFKRSGLIRLFGNGMVSFRFSRLFGNSAVSLCPIRPFENSVVSLCCIRPFENSAVSLHVLRLWGSSADLEFHITQREPNSKPCKF